MNQQCAATLAALSVMVVACGCENSLHAVGGQLVWEDDQPARELAGAMLYFESTEHRTVSRSTVQADGRFQLTTEEPETRGADGVPPGEHRVYLVDGLPSLAASRFRRPDTSGLRVKVPPEGPLVLRITRAPPSKSPQRTIIRDDEN